MKLIKMFGLTALTVVAAIAFIGTGSATAQFNTLLCAENSANLAICENLVTSVHQLATAPKLKTTLVTLNCEYALFQSTSVLGLGTAPAPQIVHGNFKYINCSIPGGPCEVKETSSDVLVEVLKTGAETTAITGEGRVQIICGKVINCVYGGKALTGHGLGPNKTGGLGSVSYNESTVEKVEGPLCPATSKLTASFIDLTHIYIRS